MRSTHGRQGRGTAKRRRHVVRAFDTGAPIELCYDPSLLGFAARPPAAPAPMPPPPGAVEARPVSVHPPAQPSAHPSGGPPPPAPAPAAPPPPPTQPAAAPEPAAAAPRFTAADDDAAVAAAFEADIGGILGSVAPQRGVAADAETFLEHASTRAPRPGSAAAQSEEEEADEPAPLPGHSTPHGHELFDRIRATATEFDAGSIALDLESAFSQFDAEDDRARRRLETHVEQQALAASRREDELEIATVEDLAAIDAGLPLPAEQAPAPPPPILAPEKPAAVSVTFDDVRLVPQQSGYSCWAAAAATIVAWRDNVPVDPAALASGTGYWERYKELLALEDPESLKGWGLVAEERPRVYTVEGLRELLERWGPLFVGGAEPGPHVRVVAGLSGDGTPGGTTVHVLDPWERGMREFQLPNAGGRYTETYEEFESRQMELSRGPERLPGIFVAHADRERSKR